MLQLRADNDRMQRTIARNGLQPDDDVTQDEFTQQSPGDGGGATSSTLQKKLSLGDPTTFGLFVQRRFSHYVLTRNRSIAGDFAYSHPFIRSVVYRLSVVCHIRALCLIRSSDLDDTWQARCGVQGHIGSRGVP